MRRVKAKKVLKETGITLEQAPRHSPGGLAGDSDRPGLDASPIFYDSSASNTFERERLQTMACIANEKISLPMLDVQNGQLIADLGSGSSPLLGHTIEEGYGGKYIPIDQQLDAVELLRSEGFEAIHASAVNTGLEGHSVDKAHCRFVFGWFNRDQRLATLKEMLRIVKPGGTITVIDYDWSAIEGPEEVRRATGAISQILRYTGFNPTYGGELKQDIEKLLTELPAYLANNTTSVTFEQTPVFSGRILDGGEIFLQTAHSVLARLRELDMHDAAQGLTKETDRLVSFIDENPNVWIKLASMNACQIRTDDNLKPVMQQAQPSPPNKLAVLEHFLQEEDFEPIIKFAGNRIVKATSSRMIEEARRLQGLAYRAHGLVDESALEGGVLSRAIDPEEKVARSSYFISLDGKDCPLAVVRYVASNMEDGLIEVSALAQHPDHGTVIDTVGAIIGMSIDASQRGYAWATMELVSEKVPVIKAIFGDKNFIDGGDPHPLNAKGINQNRSYVPLVVNIRDFVGQVKEHAHQQMHVGYRSGSEQVELFRLIYEALP